MEMKPGWLILLALAIGLNIGFMWAEHTSNVRYIRSLAELHEARASYWEARTNDIITNNTLNRRKQ
ncbi:hypothetical protein FY034_13080 [Trichlorobacter lovleyi]|nr:hypothetical protein FY034_13080 [Trichlorobacter lovleyi]